MTGFEPLDWTWTTVMLAATGFWTAILRRKLRFISHHETSSDSARLLTIATVTLVCVLSLLSSLLYADVVTVETSRFFLSMSRVTLLVGGMAVWWTGKPKGVA